MTRFCSFEGCGRALNSHSARGLCTGHYQQWARGEALAQLEPRNVLRPWLEAHVGHDGDECLIWPFKRRPDGRGQIKWDGTMILAHRQMCILAHGSPPPDKPEATHSCGNGHLGCVNPRHLRWATDKQNKADMLVHGTRVRGERQGSAKLTAEQVINIRRSAGTIPQKALGAMFGIAQKTVSQIIRGESWRHI